MWYGVSAKNRPQFVLDSTNFDAHEVGRTGPFYWLGLQFIYIVYVHLHTLPRFVILQIFYTQRYKKAETFSKPIEKPLQRKTI